MLHQLNSLDDIASTLNYDSASLISKLKETENAIALSNSISNKKTSVPDLAKSLNTNYNDFFGSNYYGNNLTQLCSSMCHILEKIQLVKMKN